MKGLESIIQLIVCGFDLTKDGWLFTGRDGSDKKDPLYGFTALKQLYLKADPDYVGRYTVPTLWDKKKETIVNNESSEIIRMMYSEFDELLPENLREVNKPGGGFYPEHLRKEIDEMNEWVYHKVNNGVYKCGFATTQEAYEANLFPLFESLDRLEKHLGEKGHSPFLFGEYITEADVRLYTTMIRFDVAYYNIFCCNLKMIRYDYPRLSKWLRNLYWDGGKTLNGHVFKETTYFHSVCTSVSLFSSRLPTDSPVQYKYGYLRAKGKAQGAADVPDDKLVIPKGPLPDIQPLDDSEVPNGH